jgi:hypothetical protein
MRSLWVIVAIPLLQFAPWLAAVLVVTWAGYPGVACITPFAWLLALRVGTACVTSSASALPEQRLLEAALAGSWFGFLQGALFFFVMLRMGPIKPSEQAGATVLALGIVGLGMLVGAGLATFMALLAERRRRIERSET